MTPDQQQAQVFIAFNALVVDDGMDPQVAHREFLKIDEYRYAISLGAGAMAARQESRL